MQDGGHGHEAGAAVHRGRDRPALQATHRPKGHRAGPSPAPHSPPPRPKTQTATVHIEPRSACPGRPSSRADPARRPRGVQPGAVCAQAAAGVAALKNLLRVAMWDECQIALEAMGRRAARAAPRRPAPPLPLPRFPLPSDFTSGACEARAREPLPPRAARRRRGGGGGGGQTAGEPGHQGRARQPTPPPYCCPYPCPYYTLTHSLPSRPLVSLVTKGGLAKKTIGLDLLLRVCPPPPPSRTKWTRLVHPSVLIGHVWSEAGLPLRANPARHHRGRSLARSARPNPQPDPGNRRPCCATPSPPVPTTRGTWHRWQGWWRRAARCPRECSRSRSPSGRPRAGRRASASQGLRSAPPSCSGRSGACPTPRARSAFPGVGAWGRGAESPRAAAVKRA